MKKFIALLLIALLMVSCHSEVTNDAKNQMNTEESSIKEIDTEEVNSENVEEINSSEDSSVDNEDASSEVQELLSVEMLIREILKEYGVSGEDELVIHQLSEELVAAVVSSESVKGIYCYATN